MKRFRSILVIFVLLAALHPQQSFAQMFALRTDVVKDLLMTPTLGFDFVVGEKHTLGAEVAYNENPWDVQMHLVSVTPEFRYWFNGRPFTRQYVGIVANMTAYTLTWNNIYAGDALGIGMSFGHVWTLTKRWNIDFSASVGVMGYKQKFYYKDDYFADYGERTNSMGYLLLPIKLGISMVYVLR